MVSLGHELWEDTWADQFRDGSGLGGGCGGWETVDAQNDPNFPQTDVYREYWCFWFFWGVYDCFFRKKMTTIHGEYKGNTENYISPTRMTQMFECKQWSWVRLKYVLYKNGADSNDYVIVKIKKKTVAWYKGSDINANWFDPFSGWFYTDTQDITPSWIQIQKNEQFPITLSFGQQLHGIDLV